MKNIKQVFNETEVTELKAGEYVMINGKPAMRRNQVGDGMEYVINNGDGTLTNLNLRAYNLLNGRIIPVHYSEEIITLNKKSRRSIK